MMPQGAKRRRLLLANSDGHLPRSPNHIANATMTAIGAAAKDNMPECHYHLSSDHASSRALATHFGSHSAASKSSFSNPDCMTWIRAMRECERLKFVTAHPCRWHLGPLANS